MLRGSKQTQLSLKECKLIFLATSFTVVVFVVASKVPVVTQRKWRTTARRLRNPVLWIRHPQRRIHNPGLSWITLHEACVRFSHQLIFYLDQDTTWVPQIGIQPKSTDRAIIISNNLRNRSFAYCQVVLWESDLHYRIYSIKRSSRVSAAFEMWTFNERLFESYDTWKPGLNEKILLVQTLFGKVSSILRSTQVDSALFNENNNSK